MTSRVPARAGRLAGLSGLLLLVILAGGCAGTRGAASGPTTSTATPTTALTTATSTPPSTTPVTTGRPTSPVAPPTGPARARECRTADLTLRLGAIESAMGHQYQALDFTNTSAQSCFLVGFPGVSYVDDHGRQVGAAAVRDGRIGAPVTLAPHQTASAILNLTNVGVFDPAQCDPRPVSGLRVYPPDSTLAMYVPRAGTGCAIDGTPSPQLRVQTIQPGAGAP